MKQEAIQKINRMGKIGQIVSCILQVITIIGIIILLAGSFACLIAPKDFLKFKMYYNMDIWFDPNALGISQTAEEQANMLKQLTSDTDASDTDITMDGSAYLLHTTDSEYNAPTLTIRSFLGLFVSYLLYLIMTFITLCFIQNLCSAFRYCESPFAPAITKKMSQFAFSLIPWVFLSSISYSFTLGALGNKFTLQLGVNLNMVLIILVIFALVFIFKYGAILQQESDETL